MRYSSRIFVSGHKGMVGSAVVRELLKQGYDNLILCTHSELDLVNQKDVKYFFEHEKPEYVFHCAGKVGGIMANSREMADFLHENILINMNIIYESWRCGVRKLEFIGSSCAYPRLAPQPIKENYLLTGPLEPTNEGYAMATISGIKYCYYLNRQYGTNYISVMPTNLYGPNDNYSMEKSHVIPGLIRRLYEAKKEKASYVMCWGDGSPLREFMFVDDFAELCIFLMNNYNGNEPINAGTGEELSIKELAALIAKVIGYEGDILWDSTMPNGTPRKRLDLSKIIKLGWTHETDIEYGIKLTYDDFLKGQNTM